MTISGTAAQHQQKTSRFQDVKKDTGCMPAGGFCLLMEKHSSVFLCLFRNQPKTKFSVERLRGVIMVKQQEGTLNSHFAVNSKRTKQTSLLWKKNYDSTYPPLKLDKSLSDADIPASAVMRKDFLHLYEPRQQTQHHTSSSRLMS